MIGTNFIYCRPENEKDAVDLYIRFRDEGKDVLYYGGGSEIITMCTAGSIAPEVVIDLKRIPSLHILQENDGCITFGAACTLDAIRASNFFPLLGKTGGRIADHTNQCRITLGGNICGTIIYREAVLPLLLADAFLTLRGPGGPRSASIHDVFHGRMKLLAGEFVVSVRLESKFAHMPHAHIKRTFVEKIGYPAVTAAAISADGRIRVALSGICSHPFRSLQVEQALNAHALSPEKRAKEAAALLPEPPRTDCEGSAVYRLHLLQMAMEEIIAIFEDAPTV